MDEKLVETLSYALESPLGIVVETDDVDTFLRRFYTTRRALSDEGKTEYTNLSVFRSRLAGNEVIITTREACNAV